MPHDGIANIVSVTISITVSRAKNRHCLFGQCLKWSC